MQQVSFKGNFLKKVDITKLNIDGTYKPIKANFIEVDRNDLWTMQKISNDWKTPKAGLIYDVTDRVLDPPDIMKKKQEKYLPLTKNIKEEDIPAFLSSQVEGTHVYAVTLQEDNFTKLESEKILGIVAMDARKHRNSIDTLQTRPDCISPDYGNQYFIFFKKIFCNLFNIKSKKPPRPYGNIGSSIITTLQDMYNTRRMELIPLNPAKPFYRKHGFHMDSMTFEYIWDPRYSKRS